MQPRHITEGSSFSLCQYSSNRTRPSLSSGRRPATRRAQRLRSRAFAPFLEQPEKEPAEELAFLDAHASPLAEDPVVQAQILSKSKRRGAHQQSRAPQLPHKHASESPQPQQPTITLFPPETQSVPPSDPTAGLDSVQSHLTSLVTEAGDAQQLNRVVRKHLSTMGEGPLVAALGKLAVWSRNQEGHTNKTSSSSSGSSSSSSQTGAGSTVGSPEPSGKIPPGGQRASRPGSIKASRNIGVGTQAEQHKLAHTLLKEIVFRGPERMQSRHLAKAIWACARLRYSDPALVKPLMEAAALRAAELEDRSLANILYTMAILPSMQVERGILTAVTSAVHPALKRFSPQALSNTVWALTRLGCKPSEGWWQEFLERSYDLMPRLNGQQFANILWAMYKADCMPDPEWTAHCLQCLKRAMRRGMLNRRDLPHVAWALANLGVRVDRSFLDSLSAATRQCMHSIDESGLCGLGYAMARLAKHASDSPQEQQAGTHYSPSIAWSQAYLEATERAVSRLSAAQVSEVVLAAAELRLQVKPSWLQAFIERLDLLGSAEQQPQPQPQQQQQQQLKQGIAGLPVWRVKALHQALTKLRQAAEQQSSS